MINFQDFTIKELNSEVRMSGLYPLERIMDRMEELYETKEEFRVTPGYVRKCDKWFDEQKDEDHEVSVAEVRMFLKEIFEENLPDSTVDKILELADQLKDGFLSRYRFQVASQLALKSSYRGAEVPDQVAKKLTCLLIKNVIYIDVAVSPLPSTSWRPPHHTRGQEAVRHVV